MGRRLFCEISPLTYRISVCRCRAMRHIQNLWRLKNCARQKSETRLPVVVYEQKSLMRRRLGNVDMLLQENKVVNLNIAAPRVSGIIIKPGETFSFWKLVGPCSARRGYREGLVITRGRTGRGIGGGMCQFTNLIHWLVLHTPLTIVEHHHHDGMDLFPDYGRQIPFGTGTSIMYNYLDYRFQNNTDQAYQLIVYTTEEYLCGEIRTTAALPVKYHIVTQNERFVREGGQVYRTGEVYRTQIDKATGETIARQLIKRNHARVMYDVSERSAVL
ncbi:VanW family protein [Feifania hominis]|uniref:VanW family protein n=1 Tax=Feifania hominis TaxID=2763660 RepID=A0A926HSY6_9FIRM|nr:VanW family protein [Feifania hominis]MBC8535309.1 VanW family protein [Feifania hominis]